MVVAEGGYAVDGWGGGRVKAPWHKLREWAKWTDSADPFEREMAEVARSALEHIGDSHAIILGLRTRVEYLEKCMDEEYG